MCVICLQFQRDKDIADAQRMLAFARREPGAIDKKHLDQVEGDIRAEEEKQAKLAAKRTP